MALEPANAQGARHSLGGLFPITRHQFASPFRLANFAARQESAHHRLDVEHWRAVDCVKAPHMQDVFLHLQQPARRDTEPVRAVLRALRENSGEWPVFASTRTARAAASLRGIGAIEQENDLDMRKLRKTEHGVRL